MSSDGLGLDVLDISWKFSGDFNSSATTVAYTGFAVVTTSWRTKFRKQADPLSSKVLHVGEKPESWLYAKNSEE